MLVHSEPAGILLRRLVVKQVDAADKCSLVVGTILVTLVHLVGTVLVTLVHLVGLLEEIGSFQEERSNCFIS